MDFGKLPPPCLYGASPVMGGCLQLVVYYYFYFYFFYAAPPHALQNAYSAVRALRAVLCPHPQHQYNCSHACIYALCPHNTPCWYYPAPAAVMCPMEMLQM
jgi:hypothetical protein